MWLLPKFNKYTIAFLKANWKLVIHLLFRTYHFGVNNQWWYHDKGVFGLPWYKRFWPNQIRRNIWGMWFRSSPEVGFIPQEKYLKMWGK